MHKLRKCLKDNDYISRIRGDEFIVLLTDLSNEDDIKKHRNRIFSEFKKEIHINSKLIAKADKAMYISKSKNKIDQDMKFISIL